MKQRVRIKKYNKISTILQTRLCDISSCRVEGDTVILEIDRKYR